MAITHPGEGGLGPSEGVLTLAKGSTLSFLGEIGHIIIIFIYGIVIARFLGKRDFGVFFLALTIFNLATLFSYCGIEDGLMRFLGLYVQNKQIPKAKGVIRFSLLVSVGLGILFGTLCFSLSDIMAEKIFHEPELATVLRYLSLGIPLFSLMTGSVASIRGFKILVPYVLVRKIFLPMVSFILSWVVLSMGYRLRGLSMTYVISVGCTAALATFLLMSFLSQFNRERSTSPDLAKYFPFVSLAFLVNILLFISNWSDLISLGMFRSSQEVGVYFASKRTALLLGLLLISLNAIFAPVISHLYSGRQYAQLGHAYKTTTHWMLLFTLPLFLIMLFFSKELLSLFGIGFKEGHTCLIILASGQLFTASCGPNSYLLMMTGHQRWMVFNAMLYVILAILFTILLVPPYGMIGAAYGNLFAVILANVASVVGVYFHLRIHPYDPYYFKILFLGVVTAGFTYVFECYLLNSGSVIFSLLGATLIFVTFFGLVILSGLEEDERKVLMAVKVKLMTSYFFKSLTGARDS